MFSVVLAIFILVLAVSGYIDWRWRDRFGVALRGAAAKLNGVTFHPGGLFRYPRLDVSTATITFSLSAMTGGGTPEAPRSPITFASVHSDLFLSEHIEYRSKPIRQTKDKTFMARAALRFEDVFAVSRANARGDLLDLCVKAALLDLYRMCGAATLKLINKTLTLAVPGMQTSDSVLRSLIETYGFIAPSFMEKEINVETHYV